MISQIYIETRIQDPRSTNKFTGLFTLSFSTHLTHSVMAKNTTILQAFEWYSTGSEAQIIHAQPNQVSSKPYITHISHWTRLTRLLPQLSFIGITSLWIPPACKATGLHDNGYGVHDLYDLGEFSTKGRIATKWGNKSELQSLCRQAQSVGIGIIFDAVLNHRASPDESEECSAIRVDRNDRTKALDSKPRSIQAWTKFNYPARNGKYSKLKYSSTHFSGTDWDHKVREKAIFKIVGRRADGSIKNWATDVGSSENGNYDYLMFADVDYGNTEVCEDVKNWGSWLLDTLPGVSGFRLDAIKHYSASFQRQFIDHIATHLGDNVKDLFLVGEYWSSDSKFLASHLDNSFKNTNLHLFDVKLMYNFHDFSIGRLHDIRKIFTKSLVSLRPDLTVTFVTNHDTQENQSLAAPIEPWFIPHAYALILLRVEGTPCVFWGDVFGINGPKPRDPACGGRLIRLVMARRYYAYGRQVDYFDDSKCIGWVRYGSMTDDEVCGIVVLINTAWSWRKKRMNVGKSAMGQIWTDIMGWVWSGVLIDPFGYGDFVVGPRTISVWTWKEAPSRKNIDCIVYPSEFKDDIKLGSSPEGHAHASAKEHIDSVRVTMPDSSL